MPHAVCRARRRKRCLPREAVSKSLEESVKIIDTVEKSKQIVQVGMQRRSAESIIKAKKLVDDGILGRITLVKPQWHWNIAKELNNSPLPGNSIGIAFWATQGNGLWNRCASGAGATSGIMPGAT